MPTTLVTISTDGVRDYVTLPDGGQINLGTVSVLKLVTTLVRGVRECRRALDTFLEKKSAIIPVELEDLKELLRTPRARWARHDDLFIPTDLRGMRMDLDKTIDSMESLLDSIHKSGSATNSDIESLQTLTTLICSSVVEEEKAPEQSYSPDQVDQSMHVAREVMGKVEDALGLVGASTKANIDIAKKDLHTISVKLASLLEASELGDPNLNEELEKLGGLVGKVQSHFAH